MCSGSAQCAKKRIIDTRSEVLLVAHAIAIIRAHTTHIIDFDDVGGQFGVKRALLDFLYYRHHLRSNQRNQRVHLLHQL